ncbi:MULTISPECIES: ROK family transcriptional regulator [Rahnella]|uniref:ROK family transcriptional regulator n=1 Tax=Rahnella TaxID=34037 RepID=UPI00215D204D|nr:ROK family transcriptional regulator [Rahnella perminowiae]MCR9002130.1 ROK family protein [Rahnella perminowiae]
MTHSSWPVLVLARDHDAAVISRALKRRRLQRLARGIYSGDIDTPADIIVRRYLWQIVDYFFPEAVVCGASAMRADPAAGGVIELCHSRRRPVVLPGITLRPQSGAARQPDDTPLHGSLWLSSPTRSLLWFFSQPVAGRDSGLLYSWWRRQEAERRELLSGLAQRAHTLNQQAAVAEVTAFLRQRTGETTLPDGEGTGPSPALSVTAQLLAIELIALGGATQSELTARLGMAKSTVSTGLQELQRHSSIVATAGARGRGASVYQLARQAGWVLGADIGNSQALFIARSLDGRQLALRQFTNGASAQLIIAAADAIAALRQELSAFGPLLAVTVALPKPVRPDVPLSGRDGPSQAGLSPDAILARLPLPDGVHPLVENNVNCAVVAEVNHGIGRGLQDVAFLQIGERIGCGIIAGGALIHGARGCAGEIADLPFPWSEREKPGELLLEQHLAQRGFLDSFNAQRPPGAPAVRSLEALLERAARGEPVAQQAAQHYGEQIGFLALGLVAILDPAMIILGGSVGSNRLIVAAARRTVAAISPYTTVAASQFGHLATAEGAAQLALEAAQRKLLGKAVRPRQGDAV